MPKFTVCQVYEARQMLIASHTVEAATYEDAEAIVQENGTGDSQPMGDEYYSHISGWGPDPKAAREAFEEEEADNNAPFRAAVQRLVNASWRSLHDDDGPSWAEETEAAIEALQEFGVKVPAIQ